MSLVYVPINGNAGQATFSLVDRDTDEVFSTATVYVADFDEEDEESEFNELFTNIIDDLIKDYHGFRSIYICRSSMLHLLIDMLPIQIICQTFFPFLG